MTYGEQFAEAVREYLTANNLNSLGKINRKILGELADRFHDKWAAAQKPKRAKPKPKTISADDPARQIPPTREMVEAYHKQQGYTFSINGFMSYYGSVDWVVGRKKMTNWHFACATFQGDAPRRATAKDAPKPVKQATSEPDGWREIALVTEGLEWAGNGPSWDSLMEFYQFRLATLCQKRDQIAASQRIAP